MKIQFSDQKIRVRLNKSEFAELEKNNPLSYQLFLNEMLIVHCTIKPKNISEKELYLCQLNAERLEILFHPSLVKEIIENPKNGLVFQQNDLLISIELDLRKL